MSVQGGKPRASPSGLFNLLELWGATYSTVCQQRTTTSTEALTLLPTASHSAATRACSRSRLDSSQRQCSEFILNIPAIKIMLFSLSSIFIDVFTGHANKADAKRRFLCVCVCAFVPAVQLGAAQEGSCSPRPSSTTPQTQSADPQRRDCAVDTKRTHISFESFTALNHSLSLEHSQ